MLGRLKLCQFVTLLLICLLINSICAFSYAAMGKGETNAFYIDEDGDGYGVASPNGPDADDNNRDINTYATVVNAYGAGHNGIKAYLTSVKDLDMSQRDIYYLDPTNGNDQTAEVNNPDKSWQSFNGSGQIWDLMNAGDICMIKSGNHNPAQLDVDQSPGDPGNPIYIYGWPGTATSIGAASDYVIRSNSATNAAKNIIFEDFIVEPTGAFRPIYFVDVGGRQNLTFRRIEVDSGGMGGSCFFCMGNTHYMLIEDCVFHNTNGYGAHGIYLGAGNGANDPNSNITIRGCIVYETSSSGIQHNGRITNLVIEDCIVHSNIGAGLAFLQGVRQSHVRNNLVFNNTNQAFHIYNYDDPQPQIDSYDQDSNTLVNNTFWVGRYNWQDEGTWPSTHAAIAIWDDTAAGGWNLGEHTIRNNLLVAYGECPLWTHETGWIAGSTIENNVFYRTGSGEDILRSDDGGVIRYSLAEMEALSSAIRNNIYADPKFNSTATTLSFARNPDQFDFDLLPDSSAINFGSSKDAPSDDLRNYTRTLSTPDAGCYESPYTQPPVAPSGLEPKTQ